MGPPSYPPVISSHGSSGNVISPFRNKRSVRLGSCLHRPVTEGPDLSVVMVEEDEDIVLRVEVHGADPGIAGAGLCLQVGPGVRADVIRPRDRILTAAILCRFLA